MQWVDCIACVFVIREHIKRGCMDTISSNSWRPNRPANELICIRAKLHNNLIKQPRSTVHKVSFQSTQARKKWQATATKRVSIGHNILPIWYIVYILHNNTSRVQNRITLLLVWRSSKSTLVCTLTISLVLCLFLMLCPHPISIHIYDKPPAPIPDGERM